MFLYGTRKLAEKKALVYGLFCIGMVLLLALHVFYTSTLLYSASAMLGFLLNTLAVLLAVVFAQKRSTPMAMHSVLFAGVLLLGSNATVLVARYNIGLDVGQQGLRMGIRCLSMLLLAVLTWGLMYLLEQCQEDGRRFPLVLLWAADLGSCLMAVLFSRGNTASVFGILIGLPMALLAILTMGMGLQEEGFWKGVSIVMCGLICATLVVKHETGIPALLYAAFFVWYTLFYPRRGRWKKWITLLLAAVPAGGVGMLCLASSLLATSGIGFLADLAGKFSLRFGGMTYQIESGLRSLAKAGWFGSYRASHIPEGLSDMILMSDTHYLGWLYLLLLLLVTLVFILRSSSELLNATSEVHNTFRSMAFCFVAVTMFYNLLAVAGIVPILGVQPFFSSSISLSYLITSGVLLGFLTYDDETMENIGAHILRR